MEIVRKLENKLGDVSKDLPNLPETTKEFLVKVWPYIALIGGLTVKVGGRLLDASVRGRLERLRDELVAGTRTR